MANEFEDRLNELRKLLDTDAKSYVGQHASSEIAHVREAVRFLLNHIEKLEKEAREFQPWRISESPTGLLNRIENLEETRNALRIALEDGGVRMDGQEYRFTNGLRHLDERLHALETRARDPMTASEVKKALGHDGLGPTMPVDQSIIEKMLELLDEEAMKPISDPALLGRAVEMLDGVLSDASGTQYGKKPTTEAEILANEFKKIRDKAMVLSVRQTIPYAPDTSTARPTIVCLCGSTRFAAAFAKANLEETLAGKIVLTVGSMTHSDAELFRCTACGKTGERETLMGEGCNGRSLQDGEGGVRDPHTPHRIVSGVSAMAKRQLDELHKKKIKMADEVLVLNEMACAWCKGTDENSRCPEGSYGDHNFMPYIGESTKSEIQHALTLKKRIRFLNPQPPTGASVLYENDTSGNTVEQTMKSLGLT
jgi:hypothetical protein